MFSKTWQRLSGAIGRSNSSGSVWAFGIIAGLIVPVGLILVGWMVQLLLSGKHAMELSQPMLEQLSVGQIFVLPTAWLNANGSILRGVLGLLVLLVVAVALEAVFLIACHRAALNDSLDFAIDVHRKLFAKSGALAIEYGLSGQQSALRELHLANVPQVREALFRWNYVFPRHLIQAMLLVALACMIQPWFTILAMLCLLLLWLFRNFLDSNLRKNRPVLEERARASGEQLASLCETAPLLAAMHSPDETNQRLEGHLQSFRQSQTLLTDIGVSKMPSMMVGYVLVGVLLMVVWSIRFLDPSTNLHFGESLTMFLSVVIAVLGVLRLGLAYQLALGTEPIADKIASYLEEITHENPAEDAIELASIRDQLAFEHVTFRDSSGQKLLEDISMVLKPRQITAIVASRPVQARALAEMIFGFGRPTSGRILIDDRDSTDIDSECFRKLAIWVAPNGPLVDGTIEANLWAGGPSDATVDLMMMAEETNVSEAILNLVDGLATMVSPTDDRLQPDQLFRLGAARALVKKPALVVAEEPSNRVNSMTEANTTEAIQNVTKSGVAMVVLPQRLATLRAAHQIVVLHEHRIAAIGSHAQLLETSEIYRHLNYIHFSPFEVHG